MHCVIRYLLQLIIINFLICVKSNKFQANDSDFDRYFKFFNLKYRSQFILIIIFQEVLMKKKYEKKKPSQQDLRPNQSMSQIRVNNFDEDCEDISFKLDFKDRQILHLWLVSILPGNRFSNFRINLNEKKIFGNIIQCEKKLEQCNNHLKCHALKSIQDLSSHLSDNMQIAIQVKFNAKIFEKKNILEACEQISHKYNYKNILEIKDLIIEKQYFYLVSLSNLESNDFISWFVQHKDDNITKDQIIQIRSESKIRSESQLFTSSAGQGGFFKPLLKNKSNQQEINYYSVQNSKTQDEQKQSSVEDEVLSQQQAPSSFYSFYDTNKQKNQQKKKEETKNDATVQKDESKKKKKYVRKDYNPSESDIKNANYIRKPQKVQKIFEKIIPLDVYDEDIFKNWVRNNKNLQWQDFIIEKIDGKVSIGLKGTRNSAKDEEKIESMKIFFNFEKVILIETLSTQQRKKVVEKYCLPSGQAISCKLIQGYMEPSDHEHKLRHLIRQNKIEKSGKKCKKFYALMIIGIKHEVDSLSKKINQYITSMPKQNLNETVFLQLGDIQMYVYENKVQVYIENAIKQYAKKFTQMEVKSVNFTINKVLLDISIQHDQYQDFKKGKLKNIVEEISKCLSIEDIFSEEDYFDQLADKYLIMKSETTPKKYVLIAEKNKAAGFVKEILEYVFNNRGKIEQISIPIKQSRCVAIKKFLQSIIQNGTPQQKQLKGSLKISFQNESNVQIYGPKKHVKQIQVIMNQFLIKLEDEAIEKTFFLDDLLCGVVEKNMDKFKKAVEIDFGLSFELRKNVDLGVVIYMGSDSYYYNNPFSILIQKSRNIEKLPNSSLVCFQSQNDLNFFSGRSLAQFKAFMHGKNKTAINQLKDASKDLQYIYTEGYKDFSQLFLQLWTIYPYQDNSIKTFAFVMPKNEKKKFILALISFCEQYSKDGKSKIRVHIFEESNQDLRKSLANLQDEYIKPEKQFRFYVFDKKQFYYSKQGEQKIKQAVERGNNFVYLTNQDLNLQYATHICSLKDLKLTHKQSGVQTKIQQLSHNRYMFTLKGTQFVIPDKQIDIVLKDIQKGLQVSNVSIGAYELDLKKMKQTNLFSGFVRDLHKTETTVLKKPTNKLVVNFDEKVNEIQIIHEKKDEMKAVKACQAILKMIQAEKTKIDHEIEKPMNKQQFEILKSACQEIDVKVEWDGAKKFVFSGFDKSSIINFIKNIKLFLIEHNKIKYPDTWCEQKNEIETFIVPETTKEFQDVQAVFKIGKIKQLMRIQNTLVYKKYEDEKQCLTKLNEGKVVRQLMLFHGTRTTDPKIIYQDKQECFNINYTGDNNYLGRGTYFAEKPQYSNGYAYTSQNAGRMFLFGQQTKEMFYCSVLVGDSQTVNQDKYSGNIRDTQFKDNVKKIRYESATTFTNGSIIYTVYKNRRAYPSYLIKY